ncbi:MAG: GIY-YIG nuclease family protein [Bdellovibrionales bacterium]|nr:GIY-YIG nuclease family protein [Oligoflexia bacterium]
MENDWVVYMIETQDGLIYTGITKNLERRFAEHQENGKGAKFFRSSRPKKILVTFRGLNRSIALKLESAIKTLKRAEKLRLVKFHE